MKRNNRRTQTTYSRGGRGGRGGRGHQGHGGRGGHGGQCRGKVRRNDDWKFIGLNGRTIRVHTAYRFENDQRFIIPDETWLKLTHTRRDYQSQKHQQNDAGSRTNSQCQHQRQIQQTYSYSQPVPETIIKLPPQPYGSIPPTPPSRKIEIYQMSRQTHANNLSTMNQGTRGAPIMGGRNEQAYLRSINTNGMNISSIHIHRRVISAKEVTKPAPDTTGSNDTDTNVNTCCLGQKIIPIAYINR